MFIDRQIKKKHPYYSEADLVTSEVDKLQASSLCHNSRLIGRTRAVAGGHKEEVSSG